MSDVATIIVFLGIFILCLGIYLIPTAVAFDRKCKNLAAIIVVNVLLGWSIFGWVGSLVWALVGEKNE